MNVDQEQAVPQQERAFPNGDSWQPGMSLRDWFAGQALNGYFAYYSAEDCIMPNKEEFAQRCYKFADAMLAERSKAT